MAKPMGRPLYDFWGLPPPPTGFLYSCATGVLAFITRSVGRSTSADTWAGGAKVVCPRALPSKVAPYRMRPVAFTSAAQVNGYQVQTAHIGRLPLEVRVRFSV